MGNNSASKKLTMTRDESRARIAEQIKKGKALQDRTASNEEQFEQWQTECRTWVSYTSELLRQMFSTSDEADTFDRTVGVATVIDVHRPPSFRARLDEQRKDIAERLARLTITESKVDLFQEPDTALVRPPAAVSAIDPKSVFIVHGHDEAAKQKVARLIEKLELTAVILEEQPSGGRTIIEKFEAHSKVRYAIILMTPDDVGMTKAAADGTEDGELRSKLQPRARQNAVLELGYFFAELKRKNVCALYRGGVELPSDIHGVLYVSMDDGGWALKLAKEMKAAGLDIDLNKL